MGSLPGEKIMFPMFLLASSLDATVLPLLVAFIQTGYMKAQFKCNFSWTNARLFQATSPSALHSLYNCIAAYKSTVLRSALKSACTSTVYILVLLLSQLLWLYFFLCTISHTTEFPPIRFGSYWDSEELILPDSHHNYFSSILNKWPAFCSLQTTTTVKKD